MPRKKRQESPTGVYHWIQRGVHRKKIFHSKPDFLKYLELADSYRNQFHIDIFNYCLMDNHIHILLKSDSLKNLGLFSHFISRRYAYYYCKKYKWIGKVFQDRYKSIPIDRDEYLLECARYIERNPVKAELVEKVIEYQYSSYSHYMGEATNHIITHNPGFLGLDEDVNTRKDLYNKYVCEKRIQEEMVEKNLLPS